MPSPRQNCRAWARTLSPTPRGPASPWLLGLSRLLCSALLSPRWAPVPSSHCPLDQSSITTLPVGGTPRVGIASGFSHGLSGLQEGQAELQASVDLLGDWVLVFSGLHLTPRWGALQGGREGLLQQRWSPLLRRPGLGALTGRLQRAPDPGSQTCEGEVSGEAGVSSHFGRRHGDEPPSP